MVALLFLLLFLPCFCLDLLLLFPLFAFWIIFQGCLETSHVFGHRMVSRFISKSSTNFTSNYGGRKTGKHLFFLITCESQVLFAWSKVSNTCAASQCNALFTITQKSSPDRKIGINDRTEEKINEENRGWQCHVSGYLTISTYSRLLVLVQPLVRCPGWSWRMGKNWNEPVTRESFLVPWCVDAILQTSRGSLGSRLSPWPAPLCSTSKVRDFFGRKWFMATFQLCTL